IGLAGDAKCSTRSTGPGTCTKSVTSQRTSRKPGCSSRWATFSGAPVTKLSRHTTSTSRASRCSHRWEPRNPAPPVTTARRIARVARTGPVSCGMPFSSRPFLANRLLPAAPGHTLRDRSVRPVDRALLEVALHGRLRTGLRLVGVLVVLTLGPPLPQQVPALVQVRLELLHAGALVVGVLGALAELVLLVHEGGDPAEDVVLVHARQPAPEDDAETGRVTPRRAPSRRGTRPAAW